MAVAASGDNIVIIGTICDEVTEETFRYIWNSKTGTSLSITFKPFYMNCLFLLLLHSMPVDIEKSYTMYIHNVTRLIGFEFVQ